MCLQIDKKDIHIIVFRDQIKNHNVHEVAILK